jgi:hypothetical protein
MKFSALVAVAALALAACGTPRVVPPGAPNEREANRQMLLHFDANKDGALSRAEVDGALRAEFASSDRDGDGRLNPEEASTENDKRWRSEGPAATPVIDWNQDGGVDMQEFANAARGMFDLVDQDGDGVVSAGELQNLARRRPLPPDRAQGEGQARRAL